MSLCNVIRTLEGHLIECIKLKVLYLQPCISQEHAYRRLSVHSYRVTVYIFFLLQNRALNCMYLLFFYYIQTPWLRLSMVITKNFFFVSGSLSGSSSRLNLLAEATGSWVEISWSKLHQSPLSLQLQNSPKASLIKASPYFEEANGAFNFLSPALLQIWYKWQSWMMFRWCIWYGMSFFRGRIPTVLLFCVNSTGTFHCVYPYAWPRTIPLPTFKAVTTVVLVTSSV